MFNTGQFCMGGPDCWSPGPCYDTVVGILAQAVPGVPVGDPFDPRTVDRPDGRGEAPGQGRGVRRAVAREDGGRIVTGGERIDGAGYYTAHRHRRPAERLPRRRRRRSSARCSPCSRSTPRTRPSSWPTAPPTGWPRGLQTRDVARAHRVAARLEAGIVWVNDWAMLDPAMPFGGVKASGFGREYGPEGLEAYTRTKSVLISLA